MKDFSSLSIKRNDFFFKKRDFSVSELVNFHISSMEKGRELNAFITETADTARKSY